MVYSALTNGTAFGTLAVSGHPGTASMGLLLMLSLLFALAAVMLTLPALLPLFGPRMRAGHEALPLAPARPAGLGGRVFQARFARLEALPWRRQLLAALGLGLLSALALPPVHAVPVLLVAIPGLLVLACGQPSWRRAAWIGFAWGWGHGVAGIWWVTEAILKDVANFWWLVPLAAPALAAVLAVFVVLPVLAAGRCRPGWPRVLGFAGAWVLAELARGLVFTGFPWNLMGTVWAFAALPVQGAAVIGVHGLSLATLLLAGVPVLRGRAPWAWRRWRWPGSPASAPGASRLPDPPDQPVQLVLVQGNVAQEVKWRQDQRMPIFRRYLEPHRAAAREARPPSGHTLAVIWPETASPFLLTQDPEAAGWPPRCCRRCHAAGRHGPRRMGAGWPAAAGLEQPGGAGSGRAGCRRSTTRRIWCPSANTCRCPG